MNKIKYVHLQVEKDGKKIVYTIFDEHGSLVTFRTRTELDNYLWRQNETYKNNLKIVDIIHINYNLQCNQLAF